jgi:drug/metabolite transporter (DMT)-like permease
MTLAFKLEESTVVVPFKYLEVVYVMIFGYFIFEEGYTIKSLVAIAIILTGMFFNVYGKSLKQKKKLKTKD